MADILEKEQKLLHTLMMEMISFDTAEPKRIQHFLTVHSLARTIAYTENANTKAQIIIEATALVHSIGALPAMRKHGTCNDSLIDKESAKYARTMLSEIGFSEDTTQRVVWLVEHFHSYDEVKTFDHQVLTEAETLVKLYEENASEESIRKALSTVFKTETGIELLYTIYGL